MKMADERCNKPVSAMGQCTGEFSSSGSPDQEDVSASAWRAVDAALADTSFVDLSWIQPPPAAAKDRRLAADAMRFIVRLVRILRPGHILEFGSGTSTRLLVKECSSLGISPQITSIDHDPEYCVRSSDVGPYQNLTILQSPLVARKFGAKYLPAYLIPPKSFDTLPPADLVLIDGPPACLGGREGVLYQALDSARRGTIVLLDDAHRLEELQAIEHWTACLGDRIETRQLKGFVKGLAATVIRQPARQSEFGAIRATLTQSAPDSQEPATRPCGSGNDPSPGLHASPIHQIAELMQKIDVKGVWNLNRFCNFSCEYCYVGPDRKKSELLGTTQIDERIRAFDDTNLRWWIGLVGGEPFMHPRFVDLCFGLTRTHYISMATNLSSELVVDFAKKVPPERVVFIHASLHYEERVRCNGIEVYLKNARTLANAGFAVYLTQVFWPPIIDRFNQIFERFGSEGFAVHPKVFKGEYQGRRFPDQYTAREQEKFQHYANLAKSMVAKKPTAGVILYDLSDDKHVRGLMSFKGLPCNAGRKLVHIRYDGTVCRCTGDRMQLGNIFRGTFEPLTESLPCRLPYCPCPHDGILYATGKPTEAPQPDKQVADANLALEQLQYEILVDRVRNRVSETLPPGSVVAIVSKGDAAMLMLRELTALHFPLDANGTYAGYHPADDSEAIRCLEEVWHRGAQFLVFPHTAFWWLDHYQGFRVHLDTHARRVWSDDDCIIYQPAAATEAEA